MINVQSTSSPLARMTLFHAFYTKVGVWRGWELTGSPIPFQHRSIMQEEEGGGGGEEEEEEEEEDEEEGGGGGGGGEELLL